MRIRPLKQAYRLSDLLQVLHSFAVVPLDVALVTITVAPSHFMLDVLFSYKVTVYSMPLGIISHIIEVHVAKHNFYASPNISVTQSSGMRWRI